MSGFLDSFLPWAWLGFQIMLATVMCVAGLFMLTNSRAVWIKVLGVVAIAAGLYVAWPLLRSITGMF